jgi:hypothetical protein
MLYIHLSSGAGTIGQLVADVQSGLSLTAPQEIKKNYMLWNLPVTFNEICEYSLKYNSSVRFYSF